MEISLISSLTPEDERRLAAALMASMGTMLDLLPIAYSIRIKTTSGKILDRTHVPSELTEVAASPLADPVSIFHYGNPDQPAAV